MADVKISALTAATTPLAGTEVLPIVQSGVTVNVAVSNLTAGRAVALGATTITGALSVSGITTVAAGSAALPAIVSTTGTADTGLWFPAADTVAASTAGAERMRIDSSGNVGIGTSSPSSKLTVGGNTPTAGAIAGVGAAGGISLALSDNTNSSLYVKHVTAGVATFGTDSGGQIAFATNGFTEAMRIDSSGNVGIGTSSPASQVSILQVSSGSSASVALSTQGLRLTDNGGNARSIGMYDSNATLGFANGTNIAFLTAGGSWQNSSDRNLKENFIVLDKQTALNKIAELPIMQWNYKIEPATSLHIGPIAQDFYAAFGVGGINGETSISTIDPAGVALLGIQALIEKVEAQAIIITALTDRIVALEAKA